MSNGGWIKLHRKIRKNSIFNNFELLRMFLICLTEASHKEQDLLWDKQALHINPGEFVTGRNHIEELYNQGLPKKNHKSGKTLMRWIENFEKAGFLSIKTTNKYTVVKLVNWELYQGNDLEKRNDNVQQMSNNYPANDQQMSTNKKEKNVKNLKDSSPKRNRIYDEESDAYILAKYLRDRILRWKPDAKVPNESPEGLVKWADEFRKLMELDKRDKKDIQLVIQWATDDTFWQTNILSATKLRKQYDQLEGRMNQKVVRMPSTDGGHKAHKSPAYEKFDKELLKAWDS
ncbi:hypothetical protein [Brevibacillus laterosporus]|uniref:hypothetical protein n=1 Tax=Brevibacillus laterosporus TaxID=1465 RepID=UPI003D225239